MQGKKNKKFRSVAKQYELHFDFRAPYNVIVDGNFLNTAKKIDIELQKKLFKIFKGRVFLCTTKCIREELKKLGMATSAAFNASLDMRTLKCAHEFAVEPSMCILSHIGKTNQLNYVVATNDQKLQNDLGEIGRVSAGSHLGSRPKVHKFQCS
jgi:U3 small nucleolar RNA-associated protein 23